MIARCRCSGQFLGVGHDRGGRDRRSCSWRALPRARFCSRRCPPRPRRARRPRRWSGPRDAIVCMHRADGAGLRPHRRRGPRRTARRPIQRDRYPRRTHPDRYVAGQDLRFAPPRRTERGGVPHAGRQRWTLRRSPLPPSSPATVPNASARSAPGVDDPGSELVTVSGAAGRPWAIRDPNGARLDSVLHAAGVDTQTPPRRSSSRLFRGTWIPARLGGDFGVEAASLSKVGAVFGSGPGPAGRRGRFGRARSSDPLAGRPKRGRRGRD